MFECFKAKERTKVEVNESKTDVLKIPTKKIKAVILIAGHMPKGSGRYGTETYNDIIENHFNSDLIREISSELYSVCHIEIMRRKKDKYSSYVRQIGKDVKKFLKAHGYKPHEVMVIEFHLNAAGIPSANGGEGIIHYGDDLSASYLKDIINDWSDTHNIKKRRSYKGVRGIKALKKGRGYLFSKKMHSIGVINFLWEPLFCDYDIPEAVKFFAFPNEGIKLMTEFWVKRIKMIA